MNPDFHKNEDKDISLTPISLISCLGHFDLDCCGLQTHRTADRIISLPENGLAIEWTGRVWCNPPYSNPKPWIERMYAHGNGVALVLASTGTRWFQDYCFTASGILFLSSRPRFTRLDGSRFQIMRDCALVAFSEKDRGSLESGVIFGEFGGN